MINEIAMITSGYNTVTQLLCNVRISKFAQQYCCYNVTTCRCFFMDNFIYVINLYPLRVRMEKSNYFVHTFSISTNGIMLTCSFVLKKILAYNYNFDVGTYVKRSL